MAINFTTKFQSKIDERFTQSSITDAHAGKDYSFDGAKTIKIYSIDSVPTRDYTRSGSNRYGDAVELGDTIQEMTMTQDRAFNFTVDSGNASDQMNIKQVAKRLKANWDEICTPEIDKYRIKRWINLAGIVAVGAALTKDTVVSAVMDGDVAMSDKLVPQANRTLFVTNAVHKMIRLAPEFINIEALGQKSVANGVVGTLNGMPVTRVPGGYFPDGVQFMIKYRGCSVDPMKLKNLRVHKNPPGIDGDLAECRFYYDSFVLSNKINGLYVYAQTGKAATTPTITVGATTTAIAASGSTSIYYTTDGTSPKDSLTRVKYAEAFANPAAGAKIQAYAEQTGLLHSGVAVVTV